jgi:ATP-dependent Clp protease ATP-binding subunit ClpC
LKPECNVVLKYFDLVDSFIRVRVHGEDTIAEFFKEPARNKASYRRKVIEACIADYRAEVVPSIAKLEEDCDMLAVEDLLYQICIDVNPTLEIHQVSIPSLEATDALDVAGDPRTSGRREHREFIRRVQGLEREIKRVIVGQDEAVSTLTRAVKKAAVGLKRPGSPIGTFFLVGRTGTGKTEIAKALAKSLFGDGSRLVRIDCSEYALPHEYAKLIGSPPGYIGHAEGGYLTEAIKKKRSCVVLFDEIEKAHSKVHNLLLQLLDEGQLTDSKGVVVPFNRTIVILTSNLGIEKIDGVRSRMGFDSARRQNLGDLNLKELTIEALKENFRPEFINRIDEVVVFNPLDVAVCCRIAERMLGEVSDLLVRRGIGLKVSPTVKRWLAERGFSEEYGARELRRLVKTSIEDPLTERILKDDLGPGIEFSVRVKGEKLVFDTRKVSRKVRAMARG